MDDLIFWAPIDLCNWIICCLSRTFNKRRSPRTHTLTQTHSLYSWKGWKNMQFLKLASLSIIKCLHLFWCCDNLQRITEIFRNGTRSYECRIAQAITFIPTRIGWVSDWCFAVTRAVDKHARADESFDRVLVLICRCWCIVRNLCTQRWTLIHYCLRCACITLSFSHWTTLTVHHRRHQRSSVDCHPSVLETLAWPVCRDCAADTKKERCCCIIYTPFYIRMSAQQ